MAQLSIPDAGERDELARILHHAFAADLRGIPAWFAAAGHDEIRIYRDGRIRAGMMYVPMGQFFGGRSLRMMGVAGVAVRADDLRRGYATAMMTAALHEMLERGFVLSTLYASTASLYRRVGYEAAGSRFVARLRPDDVPVMQSGLSVQRMEPEHHAEIRGLYAEHAANLPGHLDRGPYIWPRLLQERFGVPTHGLLVRDDTGRLSGWIAYRKQWTTGAYSRIEVTDWFAINTQAHRRLWTALRDQGTMCEQIELYSAPHDPAYLVLPDPHFEMRLFENWMVRIVDVPGALRGRGYPPAVSTSLDLQVDDELMPDNAGAWRLTVEGGRAQVERGGTGALRIHVRALASLFTGFADPWVMAQTGQLEATPAAMQTAAALFAGPLPWMREMF